MARLADALQRTKTSFADATSHLQLIFFRSLSGSIDQFLGWGSIPGVLSHLEKRNYFK